MKTTITTILSLISTAAPVLASEGSSSEGMSLFAALFMAFGVLIILFQLVPGIMLFVGMLKGIFSSSEKKAAAENSSAS